MRTWIEIHKKNLLHNLQVLSASQPDQKVACVLKANAYGHGLPVVGRILNEKGVDFYCVDSLIEAQELLSAGIRHPVLIMGYVPPEDFHLLISPMRLGVYSLEALERLESEGRPIFVHLKLETGLNRQGIDRSETGAFQRFLQKAEWVKLEGIYTHYANVEDTLDQSFFHLQFQQFNQMADLFGSGILRHTQASAAALLHKTSGDRMIRTGISLYGHYSSWQTRLSLTERGLNPDLRPVLALKTRVAQVKSVAQGATVGYGRAHEFLREGKIAVLPIGYYDGFARSYAGGMVLIQGKKAPLIGRIAMNMCMAEITHIPHVKPGDEVVLIGSQDQETILAEDWAEKSHTINYEVLTRLGEHIPRLVV